LHVIDDFRRRLDAAYAGWGASHGTTPSAFFELMDEAIEFRTVLEREYPRDPLSGPFIGKALVIGYWTAIAESWDLVSSQTEALVAEGDRAIWYGQVRWRHRRTLREFASPKVDVWTVWQGRAIRYFEMFDTAAYARAIGAIDPPAEQAA
jgi:ketosteroid isomerase-like protein